MADVEEFATTDLITTSTDPELTTDTGSENHDAGMD